MTETMTDKLMQVTCPYNNPYQGKDKRILFVCSAGLLRSATAARMYGHKYNTRSAGSHEYALIPVSANLIAWADEIVFVNKQNYLETKHFHDLTGKTVIVLDIPDAYEHMHPELQKHFHEQYEDLR